MGYMFNGFVTSSNAAAQHALQLWPWCQLKIVEPEKYFVIRGLSSDDFDDIDTFLDEKSEEQIYEHVYELDSLLKNQLPLLSECFQETLLIYLSVECFGGICVYSGYHLKTGKIIKHFERNDKAFNIERLHDILAPLGIVLPENGYFEPLTRDYFPTRQTSELLSLLESPLLV